MRARIAALTRAERWAPEKIAYFQEHRRRWERGEVKLRDYVAGFRETAQGMVPRWYAPPLGDRVAVDKAALFEMLGYRPTDPACRFHASLAKVKVFSGGAGAGKSKSAAMDALPVVLTPGTVTWLVAPQYEIARYEFDYILEALRHPCWGGEFAEMMKAENGGALLNSPKQGRMYLKLWWPEWEKVSICEVKTAKSEEALLGVELAYAILCEGSQLKREVIENKLLMRMFRGGGVMSVPSSPNGMGWLAEWYEKGIGGDAMYFATNADSRMNPLNATDERLEELRIWSDGLSDTDFNEQVAGRPQARHGNVYSEFDVSIHCDPWEPDWPKPSWPVARAIDFGYTDPFCCLWAAFDEDWNAYFFHEYYVTRRLTDDHVRAIAAFEGAEVLEPDAGHPYLRMTRGTKVRVSLPTVCDWDASQRAALSRAGVGPLRMAQKDISSGIEAVSAALRITGQGKPRLFIDRRRCPNLVREMLRYEWGDQEDSKPKPDQSDHACDAARYLIRTLSRQAAYPQIVRIG